MEKTLTTSILLWTFKRIPLTIRRSMFVFLFLAFYHLISRQRLITLHNLCRAFPEKPLPEIVRIAKGAYRHLGLVAADFFEIPWINKENLHKWVEFTDLGPYREALTQNRGILTIGAHFGNWEMMTTALPLVTEPACIVYRPLDNPVLDNLLGWVRSLHGNTLIGKEGAGRKIIRALRQNKTVGILSDQNVAAREGVFVDFFGRPACTGIGLAAMAMGSGAPVLPFFMPRMKDGRYKLMGLPAVPVDDTGDYEKDLATNTQRFTRVIEEMVRQYPEQWFWLHQRWKTKTCQAE